MNANSLRSSSELVKMAEAALRQWQKRSQVVDGERLRQLANRHGLAELLVQALWLEVQAGSASEIQIIIPVEITTDKGARGHLSRLRLVLMQSSGGVRTGAYWMATAGTAIRLVVRPSFEESLHKALNAQDPNYPIWPNSSTAWVI